MSQALADLVRRLRKKRGLRQGDLRFEIEKASERDGRLRAVDLRTIQRLEAGENVEAWVIKSVARGLGVRPAPLHKAAAKVDVQKVWQELIALGEMRGKDPKSAKRFVQATRTISIESPEKAAWIANAPLMTPKAFTLWGYLARYILHHPCDNPHWHVDDDHRSCDEVLRFGYVLSNFVEALQIYRRRHPCIDGCNCGLRSDAD